MVDFSHLINLFFMLEQQISGQKQRETDRFYVKGPIVQKLEQMFQTALV